MKFQNQKFISINLFILLFLLCSTSLCIGQIDTVVINNHKIGCIVKEITPEAVKYSFPGEDLVNSVYKNSVQKIIFKSGRVQTFAEATSFKVISNAMDFDKVAITSVESEIQGLYKLSEVSSKARGTTVYSNQERVKDRAYRKLKIQAAMFGANIIYLSNQRTEGNKYGYYTSSTAETNLTGIAYSNTLPDFDKFKRLFGTVSNFIAVEKYELGGSDSDVSHEITNKIFHLDAITNDNGIIMIQGELKGENNVNTFQLVYVTDSDFTVAYKYKGSAYDIVIALP
jgi:hypothetical protein